MTARILLHLILKVVGLFFLRDFIGVLPQLLSVLSITLVSPEGGMLSMIFSVLLTVAAYGFVAYLLLLKTDVVIDLFKMDEGIRDHVFTLNLHRSAVLSMAAIIVGALMVLNALPHLLRQLFLWFQYSRQENGFLNRYPDPDKSYLLLLAVEIIIGLLILGYYPQIVNYIERKRIRTTDSAQDLNPGTSDTNNPNENLFRS